MGCSVNGCFNSVSKFFQRCFEKFGRFIGTYPVVLIVVCLVVTGGLSAGMVMLSAEDNIEVLYSPVNSRASQERTKYQSTFPDLTETQYSKLAVTSEDMFGDLIISAKDKNVFSNVTMPEILDHIDKIKSMEVTYKKTIYKFSGACGVLEGDCSVSGEFLTTSGVVNAIRNKLVTYPRWNNLNLKNYVAEVDSTGKKLVSAVYLKLSFNLRQNTAENKAKARAWEEAFIRLVPKLNTSATNLIYSASHSLQTEIDSNTGGDVTVFAITFTLMITYATIVAGGDMVSARVWASLAGVLSAGFGVLSSFGLISLLGVKFVNIVGVMPFLIIGIGVDDMFLLMSGWAETYPYVEKSVTERMGMTFASAGIGITITSITDLLAFCIGASSVFISVRNFCIYTGVAVIFTYLYQCCFFSSCLAIHARRVDKSMHCITCRVRKSVQDYKEEGRSKCFAFCCGGSRPTKRGQDERFFEKIPRVFLPRIILNKPASATIIIIFLGYLAVSIWGVINLQQGLKLKNLVFKTSYYHEYADILDKKFLNNYPLPFVFESVNYIRESNVSEFQSVLDRAKEDPNVDGESLICWFNSYKDTPLYKNDTLTNFISGLQTFLTATTIFQNDVVFNADNTSIEASRCYLYSVDVLDSNGQANLLLRMRDIADASPLSVYLFYPIYIYFEQFIAILSSTLQTVGIALAVMTVVTFIFLPHPLLVLLVLLNICSILVGIFGFLYIWDLSLSSVTMIHLIMSVGFSVDFSVHVCSAYMLGEGETRKEKVNSAIVHAAGPILNGGISSFLGIIVLVFSQSFIFNSFFKVMFLVILFGLLHAVFVLPVVLLICGPVTKDNRVHQSPAQSKTSFGNRPVSANNGYPGHMNHRSTTASRINGNHPIDNGDVQNRMSGSPQGKGYRQNYLKQPMRAKMPRVQLPGSRSPTRLHSDGRVNIPTVRIPTPPPDY